MMRAKRKRQTSENCEELGRDNYQRKNVKRRKGEGEGQDKKPCLAGVPPVSNPRKTLKRKRHTSCESAPKKRRAEADVESNFTFRKVLGSGNYGKVLLASHNITDTVVAVKIATKTKIIEEDPDSAKIEREVLELVNESPLFTHLHQCFQSKEHLYYVLEYIGGGDLKELLAARGKLDTETIRLYAAELACAISYLQSKRVIHRDLKPENILIATDGHLKVADFGLSAILPEKSHQMNGCAGTVGYMAPEMISGKNYNFAVDWFSYGAILYEMATGTEPFYAKTRPTVIRKTIKCDVKYPHDMDRDLKNLIENLLIRSPRRRIGAHNIRSHPFFQNIDWADVEKCHLDMPICGKCEDEAATTERINLEDLLSQEADKSCIAPAKNKFFRRFSFLSHSWKPP